VTNEATNFSELLDEDLRDVFCNAEEFGEVITYHPVSGGAARRMTVMIESSQRAVSGELADHEAEEITVLVSRELFGEKGGIDVPRVGDELKRERDQQLYRYTGEIRASDSASWWLIFTRLKMIALGTNQRRTAS
jgi:hypothetical protein